MKMWAKFLAIFVVCVFQRLPHVDSASMAFDWGYSGSVAPQYWTNVYYECYGTHQSPVNIELAKVVYDKYLKPFNIFDNSSTRSNFTLTNRGMNVDVSFGSTKWTATFKGYEDMHYCYQILQMHFHWGSSNEKGSEHTIDNKMYPLELHFVTWNCRDFSSATEALKGVNGLAVIGVLFEVDDSATPNPTLEKIITKLKEPHMRVCPCANSTDLASTTIEYFDVNGLLPTDRSRFFRYKGSLTTPPCTENVLWSVMNKTVKVTTAQLDVFRNLQFSKNSKGVIEPMVDNYRPVYPLNPEDPANAYRFIAASFRTGVSSASTNAITGVLLIVAVITSSLKIFL